jgi:hypothetical protein
MEAGKEPKAGERPDRKDRKRRGMKELQKYLLMLLLLFLLGLLFFNYQRTSQIEEIKRQAIVESHKQFSASLSAFDKLSQNFYNDNNDYIARVLYQVESGGEEDGLELWREELLNRLYPSYRSATLFGLEQFQIHDEKGRSFLRFHYHEHFGDDLKPIRPSLRRMITEKRFIKGFEVGRFVDGLRYIYPLFYDGEYVGSYEWVWNHEALVRELRRIYGGRYAILVRRSAMHPLTIPEKIARLYAAFPGCPEFLYQKNALGLYGSSLLRQLTENASFCREMKEQRDYAFTF